MGKRVSFEIAKDNVEGPEDGPLAQFEDKVIKDKAESTHVEKGNTIVKRVGNDRVDPTNTPKAKGQSRDESTMTTGLQHGGDDHPSPKSYTRGDASNKTPDHVSQHTDQPKELIDEHEG